MDITENDNVALIIGRNVLASKERQREYVAANTNLWADIGRKFRSARLNLNISRKEMGKYIGICVKTLDRFEKGCNVKSRKKIEAAYSTALAKVQLEHQVAILSL